MLRTFTGHTNVVYRAILNHDEKLIASSSRDLTARVWDLASGRELWKATGFRCSVKAVAFSPDSRLLAVAGNDGMVKLFDVKSGKELRSLVHINSATVDMAVYSLAFGRDGKIHAGNGDGTISEWDTASGKETRTWKAHHGSAFKLVFSHQYSLLASIGGDAYLKLWDTTTGSNMTAGASPLTLQKIISSAFTQAKTGMATAAATVIWARTFMQSRMVASRLLKTAAACGAMS
jgi:WD40 repeat protein